MAALDRDRCERLVEICERPVAPPVESIREWSRRLPSARAEEAARVPPVMDPRPVVAHRGATPRLTDRLGPGGDSDGGRSP
jgi:hypothetical protein